MSDLNKKTLRHFYCRDVLWQCFERMSEDFDRGVDDLVNEAMRLFAREKGYIAGENESRPTATHTALGANRPPPLPPPSRGVPRTTGSVPALAAEDAESEPIGSPRRSTSSSRTRSTSSTRSSSSSAAARRPPICPSATGTSPASTRR
jgi:hypothetical protein